MPDSEQNNLDNIETTPESRLEVFNQYPWLRWLIVGILTIILILVIIFGVRAIHHHLDNKKTNGTSQSSGNQTRPGSGGVAVVGGNSSKSTGSGSTTIVVPKSGSSKSTGSSTKTQANTSQTVGPSLKSGQQLSNTGPGDVVAIFLATTLAAASLHYLVNQRREA